MANSVRLYTIAFEKDGKPIKNISVLDFLKKLDMYLEGKKRVKDIANKIITCSKFYEDSNNDKKIIISFGKLKDGLSFKFNQDLSFEEIDVEIFNVNSIGYDENEKILAYTINGIGPTIRDIEGYFNSFLKNQNNLIKIRPMKQNKGLEKVRNEKYIRCVEFILNLECEVPSVTTSGILENLFKLAKDMKENLESKTFSLIVGVGDLKRDSTLQLDNVIELLEEINLDTNFVKEIYVHYKDDKKEKTDFSSLKESSIQIKHDFNINTKLVSPEYLRDNWNEMLEKQRKNFFKNKNEYFDTYIKIENAEYDLIE